MQCDFESSTIKCWFNFDLVRAPATFLFPRAVCELFVSWKLQSRNAEYHVCPLLVSEQCLSFPVCLRCWSKSNQNVLYVCPLSIHTVFSVLVHPALVQIHFIWSVSFFHTGQFLSVSHPSLLGQKMCCHGFILGVMPFRALGSTHSSVSEWDVFLAFSDAIILQLSSPFLACSLWRCCC